MIIKEYKGYDIQIIAIEVTGKQDKIIFKADLRCKGFTPFNAKSILGAKQIITRHINYLKHKELIADIKQDIGLI